MKFLVFLRRWGCCSIHIPDIYLINGLLEQGVGLHRTCVAVTLAKDSVMQDAQMDLGGVAKRFALLCVPLLSVTAAVLFILYQTQTAVIYGLTTAGGAANCDVGGEGGRTAVFFVGGRRALARRAGRVARRGGQRQRGAATASDRELSRLRARESLLRTREGGGCGRRGAASHRAARE